jgi:hypothetical protein
VLFHLIHISAASLANTPSWQGMGEALDPIRSLMAARAQRGDLALFRSDQKQRRCVKTSQCNVGTRSEFPLNLGDFPLPLGWQLSSLSRQIVDLHAGVANRTKITRVNPSNFEGDNITLRMPVGYADASACRVVRILSPDPRRGSSQCE